MTNEQREQYHSILDEFGKALDITETEHKIIAGSYKAMGEWLADERSSLKVYAPSILPQGSFLLGTMVRPISEDDDLDIDLVCQLRKKPVDWTQESLKQRVGHRIKENATYEKMLDKEGKRCWTLKYANDKYHMDVLPSFVDDGYQLILEKSFSAIEKQDVDDLAIRITDNTRKDYKTQIDIGEWNKSNPFGYAKWFYQIASRPVELRKSFSLNESIAPTPKFTNTKLPLQRVVQLLKRHRDIMFDGDDDKPISIIITTLAARAYGEELNIFNAFENVVNNMSNFIEDRGGVKWVVNPINPEENFADKWKLEPKKEENFNRWIAKLRQDVYLLKNSTGKGIQNLKEPFARSFGETVSLKAFSNYGVSMQSNTSKGKVMMSAATGMLGTTGRAAVQQHNFFGVDSDE